MTSYLTNRDILIHILESIPSYEDLLNFGLTNSTVFSLAHPELIYRVIRCNLCNDAVWEHLIENPALASRVREVEILADNARILPGCLERVPMQALTQTSKKDPHHLPRSRPEESEILLIEALRLMMNLESFLWDRRVPAINVGEVGCEGKPFTEDVWTVLRDFTQCKKLFVVDLNYADGSVVDPFPIFRSSIFTLRNLTHINLKIIYSPVDPNEGSQNAIVFDGLRSPRVGTSRLKTLLLACPRLQALILAIIDHAFYYGDGIPYTDVTSICHDADWPLIEHLELWDLTVDPQVMFSFLLRHPSLRILRANLSLPEIPVLPFSFEKVTAAAGTPFLPNLDSLDLPPGVIQSMMHLVAYPWLIRKIDAITPLECALVPPDEKTDAAFEGAPTNDVNRVPRTFKLDAMPNLQDLTINFLTEWAQVERLAELTPGLETLRVSGRPKCTSSHVAPYSLWLPCLSRWPLLKAAHGISILPGRFSKYLISGRPSLRPTEFPREIAEAITAACPRLRYLDDGIEVIIEDGRVVWPKDVRQRNTSRPW